jgi:hypothetical protein
MVAEPHLGYVEHGQIDDARKREKAIWEECRRVADLLWQKLKDKNLIPWKEHPNAPAELIALMHSNILWSVPGAWHASGKNSMEGIVRKLMNERPKEQVRLKRKNAREKKTFRR